MKTFVIGTVNTQYAPHISAMNLIEAFFSSSPTHSVKCERTELTESDCSRQEKEEKCACITSHESVREMEEKWRALSINKKCHISRKMTLNRLMQPLKLCGIEVMNASSKGRDYLFVKERDYERALRILAVAGHDIRPSVQKRKTRNEACNTVPVAPIH